MAKVTPLTDPDGGFFKHGRHALLPPSENQQCARTLELYRSLVGVSTPIYAITDFNELLVSILDVACRLMAAEAGMLFLVNTEGNLELVLSRGARTGEMSKERNVIARGQGIAGWVLKNRKSSLVVDACDDPRFCKEVDGATGVRTRSTLSVPLLQNQKEIGVLQLLNPKEKEDFDETDREAFEVYGMLAAHAIDKLRDSERQHEQVRMDQELAFAHEIQNGFLPRHLPELPGLSFAATYRPALNIGGDFYDVLEMGPDEIYFVIGDVSGKGIPAALLMAQSLSTLRLIIKPDISPVKALSRWNEILCGQTIGGMFITAILGRIIPSRRLVEFASAGHCPPFHVTTRGAACILETKNSHPLGILGDLKCHPTSTTLSPGEWLVFYTDGLTESFGMDNKLLDPSGVERLLSGNQFASANDVVKKLKMGEAAHRVNATPKDDLTILAFGFK